MSIVDHSQKPNGEIRQKRRLWPLLGLLLIIAANALIRLPTIGDNPIVIPSDERNVIVSALWPEKNYKYGDFLGTAYRYPLLFHMKYFHWKLDYVKYELHETYKYLSPDGLRAKWIIRFENFLIMSLALIVTYAVARSLLTPAWSLAAVGLFALTPVFSAYSRITKSDGLLTFLILLSIWLSLLGLRRGFKYLAMATVAAALAFSVKFSALAAFPPALALIFNLSPQRQFSKLIRRGLLLAIIWTLTVLIAFPGVFHLMSRLPLMVSQYSFPLPSHTEIVPHKFRYTYIVYTLIFFMPFSIGWLIAPLGVLGMALLGYAGNRERWVFLAFPLSQLALFEFMQMRVWNNLLPIAPFVAISACFLASRLAKKAPLPIALLVIALAAGIEVYGSSRVYNFYPCWQRGFLEAQEVVGDQYNPETLIRGDLCIFFPAFQNHYGSHWQSDADQLVDRLKSEKCEWIVAMTAQFDAHRKFGGPEFTWVGELPDRIRTGQSNYSGAVTDCSYPTSTIAEWLDPAYHDEDFFFVVRRGGLESTQTLPSGWEKFGVR